MGNTTLINNPGFQSDEELISSFVVRRASLELILDMIRDNAGASNQHILIIGPRGSGKTTLVRRAAAEIRTNETLNTRWYPLVFPEEAYEVLSPGELWLEALFHLAEQTKEDRWERAYQELKLEHDEIRLRERALAQLMDFADIQKKRILLILENVNMLLVKQLDDHHDWELRHTLQNEPRIMMLGTATSQFEGIKNISKAWFELFSIQELKPLGLDECRTLWETVSCNVVSERRVRPLMILTGGNPRLLKILADFSAKKSFKELMANLIALIDSHTEYFKSQLDVLPPVERRIFVALLEIWDPANAQQVAGASRMSVNQTSTMLQRLVKRGLVLTEISSPKKKLYQVSERLYNIYYLMRRRSRPSDRVRAAVNFMVNFYEEEELVKSAATLAEEACSLDPDSRRDHYIAYQEIVKAALAPELKQRIIRATPEAFFATADIPEDVRGFAITPPSLIQKVAQDSLSLSVEEKAGTSLDVGSDIPVSPNKANDYESLLERLRAAETTNEMNPQVWVEIADAFNRLFEKYDQAETAYHRAVSLSPNNVEYLRLLSEIYMKTSRMAEAESTVQKIIELKPDDAPAWNYLGRIYQFIGRPDQAEHAFSNATEFEPDQPLYWAYLGSFLETRRNRPDEVEQAYQKALALAPGYGWVWAKLARLLAQNTSRYQEAEQAYRKAIEFAPDNPWNWIVWGDFLNDRLGRPEDAETVWLNAVQLQPSIIWPWVSLGNLYASRNLLEKAEHAFRKATEIEPIHYWALIELGQFLAKQSTRKDEAESFFRKATEISPSESYAWVELGRFYESQEKLERAEEMYRKAVEIAPAYAYASSRLADLLALRPNHSEEVEQLCLKTLALDPTITRLWFHLEKARLANNANTNSVFQQIFSDLEGNAKHVEVLGQILWALQDRLEEFEDWARANITNRTDRSWNAMLVCAWLLSVRGKWEEAIESMKELLENISEENLSQITEFFVNAAAKGYAQEVITVAVESKAANQIEPLIVGLRIFLQQQPTVAQEILEVGKDVALRIKQRQEI